jgi:thioredoxin reductase (NADPH)
MTNTVFAVSPDEVVRQSLHSALSRRYGSDYSVVIEESAATALERLAALQNEGEAVALLLVSFGLDDCRGIEFLQRARHIHPHARRVVILDVGDTIAGDEIISALTRNHLDFYVGQSWANPEEELYPVLSEALWGWSIENQPRNVKATIVDVPGGGRGMHLRGMLERNTVATLLLGTDDDDARVLLERHGLSVEQLPVVILFNGNVLVNPDDYELVEALGTPLHPKKSLYDVVIVGAGAAGMAAAVYAGSEGLEALVIERETLGGQAGTSAKIRNYLGFPWGLRGADFTYRAFRQSEQLGAGIIVSKVSALRTDGERHVITIVDGEEITARAVIVASGVEYRRLGVDSVDGLVGAGVFYGASPAEAMAMNDLDVFVLGAGNSAGQAASQLASAGARVTVVVRGPALSASMSDYLIKEIEASPSITVMLNSEIIDAGGGAHLGHLVVRSRLDGAEVTMPADALFVFIGAKPCTDWLSDAVELDENGFVLTGHDLITSTPDGTTEGRVPLWLETSMPGVFAAGDIRHGSIKRVAAAVGEGSTAAMFVRQHLSPHQ